MTYPRSLYGPPAYGLVVPNMELAGKVAVITGASRGIGAGLAGRFAERGLHLGLCARSPIDPPSGALALTDQVDVVDPEAVERFGAAVAARFGPIDLWIGNAGVLEPIDPLADADPDAWATNLSINVLGVANGSATFARHVRSTRAHAPGRERVLINISSGAGREAYSGWSAYCASKAAVDRLTECVALEEAGVLRAHAVAPGSVETDMQVRIRATPVTRFPEADAFRQRARQGQHNSIAWVADHLLTLAFDPTRGDDEVLLRLPSEWEAETAEHPGR